ncbi:(4Fe-4S)-binding protein [Flavobacterium sp. MAH-1]|uniref:(4Fe-4S)-binding protein n=1 Tax=Flavobacterium agri TaxID=2743471 RepID=A0A7Y8Y341_9FLAO|nr:(4Fe-4S)-binding protein [Flavobacterium agri]NUY81592.1 (4Fe-4S)-binding protein [Flavobacterium agri]NYA71616.1 (4Fe-4S)-binding protein [Flavobacterium agri]
MGITKEYSNNEITIVWKPEMCIHSTKCWKGLPSVFRPKEKPWMHPNEAPSQQIMDQISQCPSGALSYYLNNQKPDNHE